MPILTAVKSNGTLIVLSGKMQKQTLRKLRERTTFYCPQCKEIVILKVGDIVIPHFSHRQDTLCSASFSEGESLEHLQGKEQLYQLFQRLNKNSQLEPYVEKLAQRPDLLVKVDSIKYPIEFQCSSIPVSQVLARTKGYESIGMKPLWLLRTPKKQQTLPPDVCTFSLTRFEESFIIHNPSTGSRLLTYNPQYEQFHYFTSLLHVAGKRYIGLHRVLSRNKQTFPFAIPKQPIEKEVVSYLNLYLALREKFLRTAILKNRRGINDPFLRMCYELKIIPVNLPNWIGIPVETVQAFREHPCEWQLAFIHFLRKHKIQINDLSISHIRRFVKVFKGASPLQIAACLEYRDFLLSKEMKQLNMQVSLSNRAIQNQLAVTLLANYAHN